MMMMMMMMLLLMVSKMKLAGRCARECVRGDDNSSHNGGVLVAAATLSSAEVEVRSFDRCFQIGPGGPFWHRMPPLLGCRSVTCLTHRPDFEY
uniref:Putative secreted protein n=1 Tax=Anopheles darlingi TaxID=43151 RepID=A0A2M4DL01_ANODA